MPVEKEIAEKWNSRKLEYTYKGIVGQRLFIVKRGCRDQLPAIGDSYPDEPSCRLTKKTLKAFCSPHADEEGFSGWDVICDYSTIEAPRIQDRLGIVDEQLEWGGKAITRSGGTYEDCEQEVKQKDIGGVVHPVLVYAVTIHLISLSRGGGHSFLRIGKSPDNWVKMLLDAIGKVNKSFWMGGKKGTWLLEAANTSSFYNSLGKKRWKLVLKFAYKRSNWQKIWHGDCKKGAHFEKVKFKPIGDLKLETIYAEYDFNKLIKTGKPKNTIPINVINRIKK